ncbi:putative phosphoglycerate mutase pmu1 [Elasticomyces elasticus]|nr:putative phosphoglycerate mutase pmu1 [Elasticomyces elasticus]KAK3633563.1 putative phosphoglycerate mutase pmu1 [Elasticomyces elasticus]KAK4910749.1 putative phosphoglycerate mutase pmu1 [Elasticomyces elasticus]KAK5762224.1 putative phosphoglycerate mutase pmu1 [Elasticomyces elasticus]
MPKFLSNTPPRGSSLYISTILLSILAVLYLASGFFSATTAPAKPDNMFDYQTVDGYFMQSDPATDPVGPDEKYPVYFDYTKYNFGLIAAEHYPNEGNQIDYKDRTPWQRFTSFLNALPATSPPGTQYRLLYLARHGEGYHNVAEAFYGTKAWDEKWSRLDGNGTSVWSDAHLTAVGEQQARDAGRFLTKQFSSEVKMPLPGEWYVSPLTRCLETANLTWDGFNGSSTKPIIKEMVREVMGEHTCDRRSSRTVIHDTVPEWTIEDGFAEEDELWRADHRETWAEHDVRSRAFLDEVFANEEGSKIVSVTAHSGTIASLLRVTGHRKFPLQTGGMMPIFVKATRND